MIAHLEGISIARHVMITYHITTYHTGAKTTGLPPAQRPCHKQQSSRVLAKEHWSSSIKRVYPSTVYAPRDTLKSGRLGDRTT